MITTEKVKIFDNYGGDFDGIARSGFEYEKKLFDNNDWSLIENFCQDIEKINNFNFQTLKKVHVEFLLTCTYQELSMSNGWSDKYLELSTEFDKIYEQITERIRAHNNTLPKTGRSWWQKFFGSE